MSLVDQLVCLLVVGGCALQRQSPGSPGYTQPRVQSSPGYTEPRVPSSPGYTQPGGPSSPCPNVFQYVYDREGGLQGRISIVPPLSFSRVKLQLQMTVTYYPLVAGVGRITLGGGVREIQEITNKARRKEQQTIHFIVMFPPGQPVPRIAQIVINGKDFCPNNIKYPDTRGSISLNYEIKNDLPLAEVGGDQFYAPGTSPVYTAPARPAERPVQKPYEPQPIPTQFPSHVYHTSPTQSPYSEPESSTTRRPYVPPRTTQRPYVPPRTTQRPYEPPHTTQRPYEPPFRPSYESQTTRPKTPTKRPQSANNGQSESHRQCNVYPAEVIKCLKQCYQLQEKHNAQSQLIGNRHVHVRNLPTEIENDKIHIKLAEFGSVNNVTDELWTEEFEYKVKTGVRSVFIDLTKHIPLVVEIEGHDGLINYEGQPMNCLEDCDAVGNVDIRSGCQKKVPYNTPSAA